MREEGSVGELGFEMATIARIESDRIYALILPETEGNDTVTVPLQFLSNVLEADDRQRTEHCGASPGLTHKSVVA